MKLNIELDRRRALAGIIYEFAKYSIANAGGRVPRALHDLKFLLKGAIIDQRLINEVWIVYRVGMSDGSRRTKGRVKFAIDWEQHAIEVRGNSASLPVDSDNMLEEFSPALFALARFVRSRGIQSDVNDLKFYVEWAASVHADQRLLDDVRALYQTSEMSDRDYNEDEAFAKIRGKPRKLKTDILREQSLTVEWVDEFSMTK